jgi:hypothetical protein
MRPTSADALTTRQALNRNPSDDLALGSYSASLGGRLEIEAEPHADTREELSCLRKELTTSRRGLINPHDLDRDFGRNDRRDVRPLRHLSGLDEGEIGIELRLQLEAVPVHVAPVQVIRDDQANLRTAWACGDHVNAVGFGDGHASQRLSGCGSRRLWPPNAEAQLQAGQIIAREARFRKPLVGCSATLDGRVADADPPGSGDEMLVVHPRVCERGVVQLTLPAPCETVSSMDHPEATSAGSR